ncbi:MAG: FAD-dependent oxidoreductase [Raoultibacter sp.]
MSLNRRDFLKGALVTGAVAAATALPGCAAPTSSAATTTKSSSDGIGKHTWEVPPAPITDIAETKNYDIVIVGAGIAGLSAAEAAARNGATVAVIERTESHQLRGGDVGCIGSKWQLDHGTNIDPLNAARQLHTWSQQTTNYNLIRTWATRSGKVFDHIEEIGEAQGMHMAPALSPTSKLGWDVMPEHWQVHNTSTALFRGDEVDGYSRPDGKPRNWNIGDALLTAAENDGAEFIYNTHAEQLVGDAASGITGVIAKDKNDKNIQFNAAKGVILATGDIGGNQEMIDVFCPIANRADSNLYNPVGGNTGDGILMGVWAGASLSKSPAAHMIHQFGFDTLSFPINSFSMCWLAINRNGERYGFEMPVEPYLTNARMNTPGNIAWSLFDADYPTYVQSQWPESYEDILKGADEELQKRVKEGTAFRADTIEDLAKQLSVPAEQLKATIERFNTLYTKGVDEDFGLPATHLSQIKTPPFYAAPNICNVLTIPYGLHVDDNSQVCTSDDDPIDGLYAVGNVQGDFFGVSYPVLYPGISHGRCVTFGQLVGEALAKDTTLTKTA